MTRGDQYDIPLKIIFQELLLTVICQFLGSETEMIKGFFNQKPIMRYFPSQWSELVN